MKLLFISDIHGCSSNLGIISRLLEEGNYDKLVVLGDLYYPANNKITGKIIDRDAVKSFLNKYSNKLICMQGNCDSLVDVMTSSFIINSGISLINCDGLDIYITHGNEYSYSKSERFSDMKGVLVYGHEHIPYIKQNINMTYINVGSISFPRNDVCTYMIYENRKFIIYDVNGNIIDSINL